MRDTQLKTEHSSNTFLVNEGSAVVTNWYFHLYGKRNAYLVKMHGSTLLFRYCSEGERSVKCSFPALKTGK